MRAVRSGVQLHLLRKFGGVLRRRVVELVVGQDVPATLLALCGLPVPDAYQGKSLAPLIAGMDVEWRSEVFCENLFTDQGYPRMEAVRGAHGSTVHIFQSANFSNITFFGSGAGSGDTPRGKGDPDIPVRAVRESGDDVMEFEKKMPPPKRGHL